VHSHVVSSPAPRVLLSFPTRRSSDLGSDQDSEDQRQDRSRPHTPPTLRAATRFPPEPFGSARPSPLRTSGRASTKKAATASSVSGAGNAAAGRRGQSGSLTASRAGDAARRSPPRTAERACATSSRSGGGANGGIDTSLLPKVSCKLQLRPYFRLE